MNVRPHLKVVVALVALILALPSFAATKRRAVGAPTADVKLRGVVRDAATNAPIVFVDVANGDTVTQTDHDGHFEITIPGGRRTSLVFSRSGYESVVRNVEINENDITVRMTGHAGVRVRTTDNRTIEIDAETAQFAYLIPFSGYSKSDFGKFCKPGQSRYRPDKALIAKITGPATPVAQSACCANPVMKVTLTLKSGETEDVFFEDSCFGFEVDYVGRDHTTGEFVYLRFTEIAEITFP